MGQTDGIWFVCPECGASNRPGSTYCFLCGHVLDTTRPGSGAGAPRTPIPFTDPELSNPFVAPKTLVMPPLSFGIGSALMVIAVIAVCLGVWHEQPVLGIVLAVAVAPALLYTVFVAAESHARGTPMAVLDKVGTFLGAIVGVVVIAFSGLVAFVMTCFPAGLVSMQTGQAGLIFALAVGGTAGTAVAGYTAWYLIKRKRRTT